MAMNFEPPPSIVNDLGIIESFILPEGWEEAPRPEPQGGRILRMFHPSERKDVRFCSYQRTVSLSRPAAQDFQQILYSEFHDLSQQEIDSLQPILEGMTNAAAFQIREATTGYHNSRRTLRIRGRWLRPGEETLALFFDVKGDGEYVQQIYFTAPTPDFVGFESVAEAMFLSIKWKQS